LALHLSAAGSASSVFSAMQSKIAIQRLSYRLLVQLQLAQLDMQLSLDNFYRIQVLDHFHPVRTLAL
jgi:hypothetical protein